MILSKRNELGILSNFAATPFTLYGKRYASVEGFWQMMLYPEGCLLYTSGNGLPTRSTPTMCADFRTPANGSACIPLLYT